jgi:methionyl-tRNA formyltransferase
LSFGKINLLHDIYYKKKYVALYLKDGDSIFKFKYQEDNNIFYNIAIKRPILKIGNVRLDDIYYDLETAYGYGGFYTNCNEIDFIKKAMSSYTQRCKEEKIIASPGTILTCRNNYVWIQTQDGIICAEISRYLEEQ